MQTTRRKQACFFLCMIIVFFFLLFQCTRKQGTFVDELLTYDLANRRSPRVEYVISYLTSSSPSQIWKDARDLLENGKVNSRIYKDFKALEKANGETSLWHDREYFSRFITVESGKGFDFLSVMYNSVYDSAPPLYYYLVHLICSLFPDTFSLWYGLAVNLFFLMLICALLYCLAAKYFGKSRYAFLITLCYAMSIGGIATVQIIRMYALYTFFVLTFLGINLHIAHNHFTFTKKSRTAYILCAVLGFYTQYYFIIYAGLLVGVILLYLFITEKHSKKAFSSVKPYLISSLAAALISLVIWPFSIKHIFFDSFGASTFSNAASGNIMHKLTAYWGIVSESLFADKPWLLALLFLLAIAGTVWFVSGIKKRKIAAPSSFAILRSCLLLFPAAGYLFLVALSAPFLADRYIMCIFPILLLGMYDLYRALLSRLTGHAFSILCIFGCCLTVFSLFTVPHPYTYAEQRAKNEFLRHADNAVCIYISEDNGWMYKSCLNIMASCRKTALLLPGQIEEAPPIPLSSEDYDSVLVCIARSFPQEDTLGKVVSHFGLEDGKITMFSRENDGYADIYLIQK